MISNDEDFPQSQEDEPEADDLDDGDNGVTPRMERLIVALLTEPNIHKACEAARVPQRTFHRWQAEKPAFVAAYRKAKRDAFSAATALASKLSQTAVMVLGRNMTDSNAPHTARNQAAGHILPLARESLEVEDLAARIEALEQAAKESRDDTPSTWNRR